MPRTADRPLTHAERGTLGAISRLMAEDWAAMTRNANASGRHVKSLDRWIAKAREANPALEDDQAVRLAERMRHAHYVRMGRLSAQARKLAREAQAEIDRSDGAE
jgi:hypothetical protein